MQTPKVINTKDAVKTVRDWHNSRSEYPPKSELDELIRLLEAEGETVSYNKAVAIMDGIKTTKLHGWANHGWGHFKDQWRKMAKHNES